MTSPALSPLTVFDFKGSKVRTLMKDGAPWFVAKDVCSVLAIANPSDAVRSLDDDEYELVSAALVTTEGRPQDLMNIVNEPGLYSLILRSRKPAAKEFKRWITHDVIPAIRATGRYDIAARDTNHPAIPRTFAEALRLAADLQEQNERQAAQLVAASAKVDYVDNFLRSSDTCLFRQLAKHIGLSESALRSELMDRRVIFRTPIARFSKSKNRQVVEYRYEPSTRYMAWFREGDQPNAPRHHNGQMRTTLYVTPAGKVGIARLLGRIESSQPAIEGVPA